MNVNNNHNGRNSPLADKRHPVLRHPSRAAHHIHDNRTPDAVGPGRQSAAGILSGDIKREDRHNIDHEEGRRHIVGDDPSLVTIGFLEKKLGDVYRTKEKKDLFIKVTPISGTERS